MSIEWVTGKLFMNGEESQLPIRIEDSEVSNGESRTTA